MPLYAFAIFGYIMATSAGHFAGQETSAQVDKAATEAASDTAATAELRALREEIAALRAPMAALAPPLPATGRDRDSERAEEARPTPAVR
jgi:hypothetical protein